MMSTAAIRAMSPVAVATYEGDEMKKMRTKDDEYGVATRATNPVVGVIYEAALEGDDDDDDEDADVDVDVDVDDDDDEGVDEVLEIIEDEDEDEEDEDIDVDVDER